MQLVDVSNGEQVWANRYDREMEDVFAVQDDITRIVVATLVDRVEANRLDHVGRIPTENLTAYDCLLRGKAHHHAYSAEDNRLAHRFIERALELDPDYATAHAWMACVLAQSYSFERNPAVFDHARDHALTATALDDGESECHRILCAYYLMQRRFEEAEHHQHRALALNPNDDRIVCQQGELSIFLGKPADAVPWIEDALRLNPYHPGVYYGTLAHALLDAGRPSDALTSLRRLRIPRLLHRAVKVAALTKLGDPGTARALEQLREVAPDFSAQSFIHQLPYRDPADGARLRQALEAAGL